MIAFKDKHDGYYQFDWDGVSELPEWSKGMTQIAVVVPVTIPPTYRQLRAAAYPPIGDQLDDLFRQGAFSPEMAAQLKAVKTAHPKGTL